MMSRILYSQRLSFYEVLFGLCLVLGMVFFVKGIVRHHREAGAFSNPPGSGGGQSALLIQAVNQKPFDLRVRMNLAFHYGAGGQWLKSLKEYQLARGLCTPSRGGESLNRGGKLPKPQTSSSCPKEDPPLDRIFYLAFNSAVAASALGQRGEALKFYQQALAFRPTSLEVKTNIELLMKQKDSQQKNPRDSKNSSDQKQNQPGSGSKDLRDSQKKKQTPGSDRPEDPSKGPQKPPPSKKNHEPGSKGQKPASPSLSAEQVEAVLKAIEDQEKQIRKKRQQEAGSYRESGLQKDW